MTGTTTSGTIEEIVSGIDRTEVESEDGWWETSVGAEFGANKKAELVAVFSKLKHDLANAECAARMMSEAYDRMVLKYEAQLTALRESVEKMAERHT